MSSKIICSLFACFSLGISGNPASQTGVFSGGRVPKFLFQDSENDGVANPLELALSLNPNSADSDLDGFSDAEELARYSAPQRFAIVPDNLASPADKLAMGLWVDEPAKGFLRIHHLVYLPQGIQPNLTVTLLSVLPNGSWDYAATTAISATTVSALASGKTAGSKIAVITQPLPDAWKQQLLATGNLALGSFVDNNGTGFGVAANTRVIQVAWDATNTPYFFQSAAVIPVQEMSQTQSGGTLFHPLDPLGPPSSAWEEGAICAQATTVVGYSGGSVVQEVVSAQCETGWDGYCAPTCSASVGTTITTIDPAVLVGG